MSTRSPRGLSALALAVSLAASVSPAAFAQPDHPFPGKGKGQGKGMGRCHAPGKPRVPSESGSVLYFQDAHEISPVTRPDGERGGLARLATVLESAAASSPDALLAFGGDLAGGTLFGGIYRGAPFIEQFNSLGLDVASFGQHDFDYGADHTRTLVEASDFEWVSSNLTTPDGAPFLPGDTTSIQQAGELTVGVIGLTGSMQNTAASGEIVEQDPVESARRAVRELEASDVDVIIALTQIPLAAAQEVMAEVPEISVLLREENAAISLTDVTRLSDGRLIIAPEGDYGTVEKVDITVDLCGRTQLAHTTRQVDESVAPHPDYLPVQEAYEQDLSDRLDHEVATSTGALNHASVSALVADSFVAWTGADLAWINGGGVRRLIDEGPITLRELHSVLPFGNTLMKVEVTGAQIEQALQQAAASSSTYSGGFPMPAGFTYSWNPAAPAGEQVTDVLLADGTALDPSATYTLAVTNYVYNGGNGVTALQGGTVLTSGDEGVADVNALIEYVTGQGTVDPLPAPRVTQL